MVSKTERILEGIKTPLPSVSAAKVEGAGITVGITVNYADEVG